MKVEFSGKNMSLTDALRTKAENKIGKLVRFTGPIVSAHASFEVERHLHRVDLMIHCSHDRIYKAKGMAEDMYLAINEAADAIEQQAKKDKTKRLAGRAKSKGAGGPAEEEAEEEQPPRSRAKGPPVRRRNDLFHPKPLSLPDAVLLLSERRIPLVVFQDQESGRLCVLFQSGRDEVILVQPPGKL